MGWPGEGPGTHCRRGTQAEDCQGTGSGKWVWLTELARVVCDCILERTDAIVVECDVIIILHWYVMLWYGMVLQYGIMVWY